jgi:hypothetical protein
MYGDHPGSRPQGARTTVTAIASVKPPAAITRPEFHRAGGNHNVKNGKHAAAKDGTRIRHRF